MLARLRSLARDIFRRTRMERDMAAELQFHLDQRIEDLVRQGVQPEEAGRRARLEFGSREAYKERCREARGLHLFDGTAQDLRYGFRSLRRNPGFAIVVVLSLALGIGGNTAIFSLLDAVILKSLPLEKPGELSLLREYPGPNAGRFSYPMFQRLQQVRPAEDRLMAMSSGITRLNAWAPGGQQAETIKGQLVSGEYFSTLGIAAAMGRLLTAEDNRIIDGHPVAVVSYRFWQNRFGGASTVLGREIKLNTTYFTIVGVARRGFSGVWVDAPVDVWIPLAMQHSVHYEQNYSNSDGDTDRSWLPQDGISWLEIVSRTRPQEHARLEAVLNAAFQQANARYAESIADPVERRLALEHHVVLEPFGRGFSALRNDFAAPLLVLMAMVGLVLFIACANIANLLLARSSARQREIAVRLSLGAGRPRIIRQLLTESTLLALLGGAAGLVIAYWTSSFLVRIVLGIGADLPPAFALDFRVLGFATALSLVTGILFGLAPAFRATRMTLSNALKAASRNVPAGSRLRGMRPLVVFQVALSLTLLVGAGLFGRSLRYLSHLDLGFDQEHLLAAWIDTRVPGYSPDQLRLLYRRLTERLEALPGVRSVSVSMCGLDTDCGDFADGIEITGYQRRSGEQVLLQVNNVGLKYFETVGMKLLEGRDFDARDSGTAHKVAIINQAMARRYFANRNPLGQRFGSGKPETEIIGVVRDARVTNVADPPVPMVYYPMAQGLAYAESIDVRSTADPRWVETAVRKAVAEIDPNLPVRRVATLGEQIDNNLTMGRLVTYLTSAFGLLALALGCVGLYGVMSYAVARRTAELGIRMALGAPRSSVLWMVLRESLAVVAFGLAAGLPLTLAGSRLLSGMVFGLAPNDPGTLLMAASVLVVVAAFAGYLPALRASRIDPTVALRYE
jgi:predicted permease